MISNPIVFPHADGDLSLVRINQDNYSSEYSLRSALKETRLRIKHQKRPATQTMHAVDRHNVEVLETVYATTTVPEFFRKYYVVIENKPGDLHVKHVNALNDLMIASTDAFTWDLLSWQS